MPVTDTGAGGLGLLFTHFGLRVGIGVGVGTGPEDRKTTALGGDGSPETAWYRETDTGFPAVQDDGSILLQASFDPGVANFDWREFCVFFTTGKITPHHTLGSTGTGAVMLTRRVPDAPLHSSAKTRESWRTWVFRVPVKFHTPL
jgi:hypothetical protein